MAYNSTSPTSRTVEPEDLSEFNETIDAGGQKTTVKDFSEVIDYITKAPRSEIETGIAIWDKENPRSVYNLVPPMFRRAMDAVKPSWFRLREATLRNKVNPELRDSRFRIAFWLEYDRCQQRRKEFSITRVLQNVGVDWDYYKNNICCVPKKVAWILYPPNDYALAMQDILTYGIDQMREVLALPNVGANGKPDTQLIKLKIDIVRNAEQRLMGSVVQKMQVDQRSVNLNINSNASAPKMPATLEDIDREIQSLNEIEAIEDRKVGAIEINNSGFTNELYEKKVEAEGIEELIEAPERSEGRLLYNNPSGNSG